MGTFTSKMEKVNIIKQKYINLDGDIALHLFKQRIMPFVISLEKTSLPIYVRATILCLPEDTYQYVVDSVDLYLLREIGVGNVLASIHLGWTIEKCKRVRKIMNTSYEPQIYAITAYITMGNDHVVYNNFNLPGTTPNIFDLVFYPHDTRMKDPMFVESRVKAYKDTLSVAVKWAETIDTNSNLTMVERAETIGISAKLYEHVLDSTEYKKKCNLVF